MANEIFNTPIIPGAPLPNHEHHRMMILFIVVAIVIIVGLLTYYLSSSTSTTISPANAPVVNQRSQMIAESVAALKDIPPATQADIKASLKQIPKSAKPASQTEINQTLDQLKQLNLK